MTALDNLKQKVQRILTDNLGSVRIHRDGDYIVRNESAVVFIRAQEWGKDSLYVGVRSPLIVDVPISNELCRWVAIEGQQFMIGGCYLHAVDGGSTGSVWLQYGIIADDLDESELMNAVHMVAITGNKLDNELRDRFGGKLFTE